MMADSALPRRDLPQIGRKVSVEDMGSLFCESAAHGTLTFIRCGEKDEVIRYSVDPFGISIVPGGYRFSPNHVSERTLLPGQQGYSQAHDMLRRAKL